MRHPLDFDIYMLHCSFCQRGTHAADDGEDAMMTKAQKDTLKKVASAGADGLDAYDMATCRYTTSPRVLGALIDAGLVVIRQDTRVTSGRVTRYHLTDAGRSSAQFGPCEVCEQHCAEVFYQVESVTFDDDGIIRQTYTGCTNIFGHEVCLRSKRRTVGAA